MGSLERTFSREDRTLQPLGSLGFILEMALLKGGKTSSTEPSVAPYTRPLSFTRDTYQHANPLWMVPVRTRSKRLEVDTSCYLRDNVGCQRPSADEMKCHSVMIEMEETSGSSKVQISFDPIGKSIAEIVVPRSLSYTSRQTHCQNSGT